MIGRLVRVSTYGRMLYSDDGGHAATLAYGDLVIVLDKREAVYLRRIFVLSHLGTHWITTAHDDEFVA